MFSHLLPPWKSAIYFAHTAAGVERGFPDRQPRGSCRNPLQTNAQIYLPFLKLPELRQEFIWHTSHVLGLFNKKKIKLFFLLYNPNDNCHISHEVVSCLEQATWDTSGCSDWRRSRTDKNWGHGLVEEQGTTLQRSYHVSCCHSRIIYSKTIFLILASFRALHCQQRNVWSRGALCPCWNMVLPLWYFPPDPKTHIERI